MYTCTHRHNYYNRRTAIDNDYADHMPVIPGPMQCSTQPHINKHTHTPGAYPCHAHQLLLLSPVLECSRKYFTLSLHRARLARPAQHLQQQRRYRSPVTRICSSKVTETRAVLVHTLLLIHTRTKWPYLLSFRSLYVALRLCRVSWGRGNHNTRERE